MKKVIAVILVAVFLIGFVAIFSFNDHTYVGTVTEKERINKGGSSYYLIFTESESGATKVLKNEDEILRGKLGSSDLYAQLKEGQKYKFTLVGYRIKLLSMYENIIKIERVEVEK